MGEGRRGTYLWYVLYRKWPNKRPVPNKRLFSNKRPLYAAKIVLDASL